MLKKIAVAALAGSALFAASGAAQARHYGDGYRPYHYGYHYRHAPRVVYRPAPVYYYYPAPRYYYYEPSPTIYGRIPIGHHGSIGFRLPL